MEDKIKEAADEIMEEMIKLYDCNQIDELVKIRDSKNEADVRRLAANVVLQSHRDARRLY